MSDVEGNDDWLDRDSMTFTDNEKKFIDKCLTYVKTHKKRLVNEITDTSFYPAETHPVSVFMAGSPGAGKTEVSKALASQFKHEGNPQWSILRIDPDEYRVHIPGYNGSNSRLVQGAVSLLVEKLFDAAMKQQQSFILDGTLSSYEKARSNVERCLAKSRDVHIWYVYQPPELAWKFVEAREAIEGRNIPFERFARQFLDARSTVQQIKATFGEAVTIVLLVNPLDKAKGRAHPNVLNFDDVLGAAPSLDEIYALCKQERSHEA